MKISESWLREWVDPDLDTTALAHQLTMLGHEVDEVAVQGVGLEGVVVAEILDYEKHPDADRLNVCRVSTGHGDPIQIVCGAPNVRKGLKSVLAQPGVVLPNGMKLKKSKIRGVESFGMLCSAVELGLGQESDGILELPGEAPVGDAFPTYLGLPDAVIDVDLTPNRGDCFSVLGLARDVSAVTGSALKAPEFSAVAQTAPDTHPVVIEDATICPSFAGRVIKGIDAHAKTPLWIRERLRKSGLRSIHPVVDVTNFVMLELGQPCHAYDLSLLQGAIAPRLAKNGETLVLLVDKKSIDLKPDTVVIADDSGPIGLAGIMGGDSTAVSASTVDIFFEAAFWPQDVMAGRARAYGLHTDASLRFERGVDPQGQVRAVERATALILEICGGVAGPCELQSAAEALPARAPVTLRRARLDAVLGTEIPRKRVSDILAGLHMTVAETESGWTATPPSHRFDVNIEADLIEEVARIHGYDSIEPVVASADMPLGFATDAEVDIEVIAGAMVARDFQEAITYSFVEPAADALFTDTPSPLLLANPISSEMAVMRSSLLPGLLQAVSANLARQQPRVRLFEIGKSFHGTLQAPEETTRLAAVITGTRDPEQWGGPTQGSDFFDLKSDLEAILGLSGAVGEVVFAAAEVDGLQPGQSASILRGGETIGVIGKLHPQAARALDIKPSVFVFELDVAKAFASDAPRAKAISRYPAIRRDLAIVVDEKLEVEALINTVKEAAPDLVQSVRIFDIYQGEGIEAGRKSVALGLILQETSRTLTDDDADSATAQAVQKLQQKHAAELRD